MIRDLIVIGGGPAGMAAALAAHEAVPGASVTVLDGGSALATLLATGGGRGNLTNARIREGNLGEFYPRGASLLCRAVRAFDASAAVAWFGSLGVPCVEEDRGRVFPRSGRAADVRDALLERARGNGVEVRGNVRVSSIEPSSSGFTVRMGADEFGARRVVLATGGGLSRGGGEGLAVARELGHTVTALRPSLCALALRGERPAGLSGVSLDDAAGTLLVDGCRVGEARGGLLFTHRGVSGPVVLDLSAWGAGMLDGPGEVSLVLDLVPCMTVAELDAVLREAFDAHPRRSLAVHLGSLAPRAVIDSLLEDAKLDGMIPGAEVSRVVRRGAVGLLKELRLAVTGRDGDGMTTAGGVAEGEVDPRSMASRLVHGLHLAGEVLDVDGVSGGFNLHAAWSTGRLAGLAAAP